MRRNDDVTKTLNVSKFKERIKLLCRETGISQKHLTDVIGRKNTYLNDVWNGKCALKSEYLSEFAKILGTSCEYLSGEIDSPIRRDSDTAKKIFKERGKVLCKSKGLSQKFVSESTGHGQFFLNDVWLGKRAISDRDMEMVASALSTTSAYLSGETDDPVCQDSDNEVSAEDEELLALFKKLSVDQKETLKKFIEQIVEKK